MKLNKTLLAAIIAFGMSSAAQAADQGNGVVRFAGSIIDAPCSLAPESEDQTVQMGQVSKAALSNGGMSNSRAFEIKLEQCDTATLDNVKVTFTGAQDSVNNDLLAINGSASGAAIAIEYNGTVLPIGTQSPAGDLHDGNNILQFAAYLQGTTASGGAVPGEFFATANFALDYE